MKDKERRLNAEDGMSIQACIHCKMGIYQIAARTGFSKSAISREIKNNSIRKPGMDAPCRKRAAGVCNCCPTRAFCHRGKAFYDFAEAEGRSRANRSVPRSRPKLAKEAIAYIDSVVSDGVAKGQSLHHIYMSDPGIRKLASERTVRRLCYRGCLSVKAHQLRRYVRFRHPLKGEPRGIGPKDIRALMGRTYRDYLARVKARPRENVAQYDSVIGKATDGKALLTVTFPKYGFQFGLVIKKGDPSSAVAGIRSAFGAIGDEAVRGIFPINLADNGSEFAYFPRIEPSRSGDRLCSTYFTSPYKATDKAECERLHELVRYCLPKGRSLDSLTQEAVDEMYSNINSYVRKSQGDQTPYDKAGRKFGDGFLAKIGIRRVPKKRLDCFR